METYAWEEEENCGQRAAKSEEFSKANARVWSSSGAAKVLSHFWVNCMVQQCALRYIPAALRLVCLCSLICPSKAKHLLLCSFSVHFDLLRAKSCLVHETCLYTMCREFHRSLTAVKSFLLSKGRSWGALTVLSNEALKRAWWEDLNLHECHWLCEILCLCWGHFHQRPINIHILRKEFNICPI